MPEEKKKLSAQPVISTVPARTRVPVLLNPADEPDPAKRNPTVGLTALGEALGVTRPANNILGARKYFAYLTDAAAAADNQPQAPTLERADAAFVCLHNPASVDLPRALELEAVFDDGRGPYLYGNGFRGYYDGTGKLYTDRSDDGLLPLKWALKAPTPNNMLGVPHYYAYLTYQEASDAGYGPHGDEPAAATLDQCDPLTVCIGAEAYVDLPSQLTLVAIYDNGRGPYPYGPGFRGYYDGNRQRYYNRVGGDGLLALKWVRKGSPEAGVTANVAPWSATYNQDGTPPGYKVNDLVSQAFAAGTFTFQALVAGQLPAPAYVNGDANWRRFVPVTNGPVANDILGAPKSVAYRTRADAAAAGFPERSSLDQIDSLTVSLHTTADVDDGQLRLEAVYDSRTPSEFRGYLSSDGVLHKTRLPPDGLLPMKWALVNSPTAGVPAYAQFPSAHAFVRNDLVRAYVAGNSSELFFAAQSDGPLPAPTSADGDANWRRVAEQDVPTAGGLTQVRLTVEELPALVGSFVPGQQYLITNAPANIGFSLLDPPTDTGPLMVWAQDENYLAPFGFIAGGLSGNGDSLVQVYDGPARNLLLLVLPVPGQGIYRGEFQPGYFYFSSQLVGYQGALYDRIDSGAATAFVPAEWRLVAGGGGSGTILDPLDLTTEQMDAVMALTYVNCDADPAASPSWSRPGQEFEAIDPADSGNYYYRCRRGTYVRGNSSTGAGPAWHRVAKM